MADDLRRERRFFPKRAAGVVTSLFAGFFEEPFGDFRMVGIIRRHRVTIIFVSESFAKGSMSETDPSQTAADKQHYGSQK